MLLLATLQPLSDRYESLQFFSRYNLSCSNVRADVSGKAECWYCKTCLKLRSELQVLTPLKSSLYLFFMFYIYIYIYILLKSWISENINFLSLSRDIIQSPHRILSHQSVIASPLLSRDTTTYPYNGRIKVGHGLRSVQRPNTLSIPKEFPCNQWWKPWWAFYWIKSRFK